MTPAKIAAIAEADKSIVRVKIAAPGGSGDEMRVLKKTVAMRKKQIRNLYEVVGSWRTLARDYFGGEIKHGTLQRFATDKTYIPADERLLRLLDLVEPPNPYRVLPRWYRRIPEALTYFDSIRSRTSELSVETRRSFKHRV